MRLALVIFLALILQACALHQWQPSQYTVARGDTLYSIAWRYSTNFEQIALWNGLQKPYLIYPGQRIWVSQPLNYAEGSASSNASQSSTASNQSSNSANSYGRAPQASSKPSRSKKPKPRVVKNVNWKWPIAKPHTIREAFSGKENKSQGIDFKANYGDLVYAAGTGKVVYSGTGLPAYGKLIIIKHNETFLSAYAFNKTLLVKENQTVIAGQKISEVGRNLEKEPGLYLEIRKFGKPVDPKKYLP